MIDACEDCADLMAIDVRRGDRPQHHRIRPGRVIWRQQLKGHIHLSQMQTAEAFDAMLCAKSK
jgi:hypothetical protein